MSDVVLPDTDVFRRFLAAPDDEAIALDSDQIAIDIIARILDAQTVDDVLGGGGATHAEDYLDRGFVLKSVRFNKSTFDSAGPNFYAVLEGYDEDSEPVAITCGSRNVIAQAWKLMDMGALPLAVEIKRSAKPTSAGFYVMWLDKATKSF